MIRPARIRRVFLARLIQKRIILVFNILPHPGCWWRVCANLFLLTLSCRSKCLLPSGFSKLHYDRWISDFQERLDDDQEKADDHGRDRWRLGKTSILFCVWCCALARRRITCLGNAFHYASSIYSRHNNRLVARFVQPGSDVFFSTSDSETNLVYLTSCHKYWLNPLFLI